MTQKEAVQILAILKAAYPQSYNGMSQKEAMGTVNVWCTQFANLSANIVLMAVNKLISSCKFPPSIAEVKDKIVSIHWEAYEAISENHESGNLSEEAAKLYQRIYEETRDYRYSKFVEPSLSQMLIDSSGKGVKMIE